MRNKRVAVELIREEKKRRITYMKRKTSLLKKAREFSILCNVPACVIIVPTKTKDQETHQPPKVETWPPLDSDVREVIARYKATIDQPRNLGVSDYFIDKKHKVDLELAKLNGHIWERKYTAWNRALDGSSDAELQVLLARLSARFEAAERRCLMLKGRVCLTDGVGTSGQGHQNMSCGSDYYPEMVGNDLLVGGMQPWINPSPLELNSQLALPSTRYLQPVQPRWSGLNANILQRGYTGLTHSTDLPVLSNSRFQGPFGFKPRHQAPLENWDNCNHPENHWSDVGSSINNPFASSEWQQPSVSFNPCSLSARDNGMMLMNWTYPSLSSIAAMLPSFQPHTTFLQAEVPCPTQARSTIELCDVSEPQVGDQTRIRL